MDWQPIETAPKDGTWVLLTVRHVEGWPQMEVGQWTADQKYRVTKAPCWCDTEGLLLPGVTHWMPLPKPPETG